MAAAAATRRGARRSLGPKHKVAPGTGWGSVDVDDVLAVLDAALDRYPFCDPDRVGMLGGSYGGYMATMLAGRHGDRFRAICSERAVNNLLSEEWAATSARRSASMHGADLPRGPRRVRPRCRRSATSATSTCRCCILHSENDLRCPIVQAEELFMALRLLGKDVTFYRFPGEGHELSRSGSPLHRRMRAEIILDFFTEKLQRRSSATQASMSLRAIEMPGGMFGSASRRYQPASAISVGSSSSSPDT